MGNQTCKSCCYYNGNQCKFNAPQLTQFGTMWPNVASDDWCGEWKFKDEEKLPDSWIY
jgi:ribosomal protein L32